MVRHPPGGAHPGQRLRRDPLLQRHPPGGAHPPGRRRKPGRTHRLRPPAPSGRGRRAALRRPAALPAHDHRPPAGAVPPGTPGLGQAADGYARENEAGPALEDPERRYRDAGHKPETVLALTRFEAVAGLRAPRRAVEVLSGLDSAPAHRMRRTLRLNPTRFGIRQVLTDPHRPGRRPDPPQRPGDRGAGGADRRPL